MKSKLQQEVDRIDKEVAAQLRKERKKKEFEENEKGYQELFQILVHPKKKGEENEQGTTIRNTM